MVTWLIIWFVFGNKKEFNDQQKGVFNYQELTSQFISEATCAKKDPSWYHHSDLIHIPKRKKKSSVHALIYARSHYKISAFQQKYTTKTRASLLIKGTRDIDANICEEERKKHCMIE